MWKEALTICQMAHLDRVEAAERLIESMIENRRFQEVSTIYLQYLKDPSAAVDILIKGFLWSEAVLVCTENGMAEKIDSILIPAIKNAATNFRSDINEAINEFEKQTFRLRQVRIEKKKPVLPADGGENDEKLDNIDMLSDTTSMATTRITSSSKSTAYTGMTGLSVKTGRTSRQKRKLAKKRATGKDAAYEDEYLMKSLKSAVEKFNSQTGILIQS
jgi:elongator complex protein 1